MARQKRRIYLCEGETEQHLVKVFVQARLIQPGKAERFNVVQMEAKKLLRKLGRDIQLIVIIDADTGPYDDNSQLAQNFRMLEKYTDTPGLIIQCMNLEDELAHSSGMTRHQLYQAFGAASAGEFKELFLKVRKNQLLARLRSMGFQSDRLWQQTCRSTTLQGALAGTKVQDIWK